MAYVVGTTSQNVAGSFGPAGTLHAIGIEEVYNGLALCGAEVYAWPEVDFPTDRPRMECEICRRAADFGN